MALTDPVGISYAVAAVVFGWIAHLTWNRRQHNPTLAGSLAAVMVGLAAAAGADAVAVSTTSERIAAVASLAILPGTGLAAGAFACLGVGSLLPQWAPGKALIAWLLVEPVAIAAAAATNPVHEWVYGGSGAGELTGSATWLHNPGYWWHAGYCYAMFGVGLVLFASAWWTAPPAFRRQRLAFLVATLVPLVGNAAYVAGGFNEKLDPTPFALAAAGAIMAYSILKHDLLTFSPVARALIVNQIGDAVMVLNPQGRVLDLNAAGSDLVRAMCADAPTDLIGLPAATCFGLRADAGDAWTEITVDLPRGPAEFEVHASPLVDARGRVLGEVFVARDVTETHAQARNLIASNTRLVAQLATIDRLRADLVELSSRDALTGLHNRRYMVDRFEQMVAAAERTGEPLAVVLLDIDRFKAINDVHGHLTGDAVLVALAGRIRAQAPAGALVARWGGEEFFVALPGADGASGLAFAEGVRLTCSRDGVAVAGRLIGCTLSGGVATYPESGVTLNELFHAADVALFEAKDAGRNGVRLHVRSTGPLLGRLLSTT